MTSAEELIANAKALLLDFDGPVTALMPPPLNAEAAESVRRSLKGLNIPDDMRATTDHLAVLRWTVANAVGRLADVERASTAVEVACAGVSEPSPEVGWLLDGADSRGVPVAVVSNNSEEAVRVFFDRFGWSHRIAAYACRTLLNARFLKPNPHLVISAARTVAKGSTDCVFIGDSVSDIEAAKAAGVPVVGLAKSAVRADQLLAAGADGLLIR